MPSPTTRFDTQASGFDERVGIGPAAARDVAQALAALASLSPAGRVLEIGPGTGEIGSHLAADHRYTGLDLSRPMLEVFAGRLSDPALLVQADAARPWPVRSQSVHVVFASRAAHLVDPGHLVDELVRVCRPGGHVLLGRVERQRDGLRSRLRERRRALLAEHGVGGGRGGNGANRGRAVLERLVNGGGTALDRRAVARWTVETSAAELIAGWRDRRTVGGQTVPAELHDRVLDELAAEARPESQPEVETYTLEGVRLP